MSAPKLEKSSINFINGLDFKTLLPEHILEQLKIHFRQVLKSGSSSLSSKNDSILDDYIIKNKMHLALTLLQKRGYQWSAIEWVNYLLTKKNLTDFEKALAELFVSSLVQKNSPAIGSLLDKLAEEIPIHKRNAALEQTHKKFHAIGELSVIVAVIGIAILLPILASLIFLSPLLIAAMGAVAAPAIIGCGFITFCVGCMGSFFGLMFVTLGFAYVNDCIPDSVIRRLTEPLGFSLSLASLSLSINADTGQNFFSHNLNPFAVLRSVFRAPFADVKRNNFWRLNASNAISKPFSRLGSDLKLMVKPYKGNFFSYGIKLLLQPFRGIGNVLVGGIKVFPGSIVMLGAGTAQAIFTPSFKILIETLKQTTGMVLGGLGQLGYGLTQVASIPLTAASFLVVRPLVTAGKALIDTITDEQLSQIKQQNIDGNIPADKNSCNDNTDSNENNNSGHSNSNHNSIDQLFGSDSDSSSESEEDSCYDTESEEDSCYDTESEDDSKPRVHWRPLLSDIYTDDEDSKTESEEDSDYSSERDYDTESEEDSDSSSESEDDSDYSSESEDDSDYSSESDYDIESESSDTESQKSSCYANVSTKQIKTLSKSMQKFAAICIETRVAEKVDPMDYKSRCAVTRVPAKIPVRIKSSANDGTLGEIMDLWVLFNVKNNPLTRLEFAVTDIVPAVDIYNDMIGNPKLHIHLNDFKVPEQNNKTKKEHAPQDGLGFFAGQQPPLPMDPRNIWKEEMYCNM